MLLEIIASKDAQEFANRGVVGIHPGLLTSRFELLVKLRIKMHAFVAEVVMRTAEINPAALFLTHVTSSMTCVDVMLVQTQGGAAHVAPSRIAQK